MTLTGTTGTLYVNGAAVGRNTAMTLNPAALGTLANNWLGRSSYSADPVFAGAFNHVDIWSRALTATEIAELQDAPADRSSAGAGDVASYTFGETSGSTFADASGRGRPATLRRTWGSPSHPGFLAAYPETQFITLESMATGNYIVVWAPYYTAHKILRGVLDAYINTGDDRALDLAAGMCDWMYSRLSKLPAATRQRMWGIFSSGEFGGIVEAICDLYAITGKPEHLALARLFDLDRLIDACVAGTDILNGMHANQHIPIFTGLVRLYDETGEERYLTAAKNFWGMVVPTRMYGIGGTSTAEFRKAPRGRRRHAQRHQRRDLLRVQHAQAEPDAVLPRAGPGVHGLLRADALQPGSRLQAGPAGRREAARHLLHRAAVRAGARLHTQGGYDVL